VLQETIGVETYLLRSIIESAGQHCETALAAPTVPERLLTTEQADQQLDRINTRLCGVIGPSQVVCDLVWLRHSLQEERRCTTSVLIEAKGQLADEVLCNRTEGIQQLLTEVSRVAFGIVQLAKVQLRAFDREKPRHAKLLQSHDYSKTVQDAAETLLRAAKLTSILADQSPPISTSDSGVQVFEVSKGELDFTR
jgi:hypothetical protein